jgi:hypothetical protein
VAKINEDARRCERCGYQWFAVRPKKVPKPRWFDETGAVWTDSKARMARLQGNYDRHKTDHDRWALCPQCGTVKIRTVDHRGFVPTAAVGGTQPSASPVDPGARPVAARPADPISGKASSETPKFWAGVRRALVAWWRTPLAVVIVMGLLGVTGLVQTFTPATADDPKPLEDRILSVILAAVFLLIAAWRARELRNGPTDKGGHF